MLIEQSKTGQEVLSPLHSAVIESTNGRTCETNLTLYPIELAHDNIWCYTCDTMPFSYPWYNVLGLQFLSDGMVGCPESGMKTQTEDYPVSEPDDRDPIRIRMMKIPAHESDDGCARIQIRMRGHIYQYVCQEPFEAIIVNSPKVICCINMT